MEVEDYRRRRECLIPTSADREKSAQETFAKFGQNDNEEFVTVPFIIDLLADIYVMGRENSESNAKELSTFLERNKSCYSISSKEGAVMDEAKTTVVIDFDEFQKFVSGKFVLRPENSLFGVMENVNISKTKREFIGDCIDKGTAAFNAAVKFEKSNKVKNGVLKEAQAANRAFAKAKKNLPTLRLSSNLK